MSVVGRLKLETAPVVVLPLQRDVRQGRPARGVDVRSSSGTVALKPRDLRALRGRSRRGHRRPCQGRLVVTAGVNQLRENQKVRLARERGTNDQLQPLRLGARHKSFVVYLMLVTAIAGAFAYMQLGREEDPPFTIKTMVVKTLWPGATTPDTLRAGDRPDREEARGDCRTSTTSRSYTKPGESVVFVNLKDIDAAPATCPTSGTRCARRSTTSSRHLPLGIVGPFFNDEFGDTYSLIYALHRRRLHAPRAARLGWNHARRTAARAAMSPRSSLSACRTRRSTWTSRPSSSRRWASIPNTLVADAAGAERDPAERHRRCRPREIADPGVGRVHLGGEPEGRSTSAPTAGSSG